MSDTELDDNKSEILDVCEDENITEDEVKYFKYIPVLIRKYCSTIFNYSSTYRNVRVNIKILKYLSGREGVKYYGAPARPSPW